MTSVLSNPTSRPLKMFDSFSHPFTYCMWGLYPPAGSPFWRHFFLLLLAVFGPAISKTYWLHLNPTFFLIAAFFFFFANLLKLCYCFFHLRKLPGTAPSSYATARRIKKLEKAIHFSKFKVDFVLAELPLPLS